jgi:hypothetical protein
MEDRTGLQAEITGSSGIRDLLPSPPLPALSWCRRNIGTARKPKIHVFPGNIFLRFL